VVTTVDLPPITIIDVSCGLPRAVVPVASSYRSRIVGPFPRVSSRRSGNGPVLSLRPSLITDPHSVSSLNDLAREASPSSRYLCPARDEDTTNTVRGNCSRIDGDKCAERIEPRSESSEASVDPTEARNALRWPTIAVGWVGRPAHSGRWLEDVVVKAAAPGKTRRVPPMRQATAVWIAPCEGRRAASLTHPIRSTPPRYAPPARPPSAS
jgi:hypothetical protein